MESKNSQTDPNQKQENQKVQFDKIQQNLDKFVQENQQEEVQHFDNMNSYQQQIDENQLQDFIDNLNRRTSEYRQSFMMSQQEILQIQHKIQEEEQSAFSLQQQSLIQEPYNQGQIFPQTNQYKQQEDNSKIDPNAFVIRNLDTGETIDISSHNIDNLEKQFNQLFGSSQNQSEDKAWYENYCQQRRKLQNQLWKAAENGDSEQVKQLLNFKIHGDLTPSANGQALHLAAQNGHDKVIEVLLDYGKDVEISSLTSMNRTPLHLAVSKSYIKVIDLLVRSGADVNAQDCDQNTCLHIASMNGQVEAVKYLLERRNINVDIKNFEGKTPPEVAQNYETLQAFEYNIPTTKNLLAQNKEKYGRVAFHKVLIHNSRSDQVKKMLQAMQKPVSQKHDINKIMQEKRDIREQKQKEEKEKQNAPKESVQESEEIQEESISSFSQQSEIYTEKIGPENFKVIAELGRGSFGEVYLVEKIDSREQFAMKILNKNKVLGNNLVRYAMTERNVLSYSRHPFIVGLNYAFQTKDKLYLLLDYASGGDLGYQLNKEKRFPEWRARIYLSEIILALEYLHSRDIIFRDLKPENVVLDEKGHAMLTDFGLSKEGVFQEKQARSFCGSVAYLAPEMLKRAGHGKSVDWYLAGVLLYELLSGAPPYFTNNREQLFLNIEKSKLKIPGYVSFEAKSLLQQLLEKNPAKRLGTQKGAEELKQHAFFKGIDWEAVYKRELRPPPHQKKPLKNKKINQDRIQGEPETGKTQLVGWSFVIPSQN